LRAREASVAFTYITPRNNNDDDIVEGRIRMAARAVIFDFSIDRLLSPLFNGHYVLSPAPIIAQHRQRDKKRSLSLCERVIRHPTRERDQRVGETVSVFSSLMNFSLE